MTASADNSDRTTPPVDEAPGAPADRTAATHPSGALDGTQAHLAGAAANSAAGKSPPPKVVAHYELGEKLGEGGMGAVYKGWHPKLQRFAAIKLLPAELLRNPSLVRRFEHEIALAAKLDHPHVVRTYDAGEEAGTHYLVLEYLEGTDLSQLVKTKGPLSVENALAAIRQAALGLQHAHEQGLVHRDIKPANLMLHRPKAALERSIDRSRNREISDERSHEAPADRSLTTSATKASATQGGPRAPQPAVVKVMDFGLALLTDSNSLTELTKSGQIMGTPEYMAPEQWESTHEVDARADLYSLGATLHFLLLGRSPYRRSETTTVMHLMKSHVMDPIPDLTALRPDVPPAVNALFQRLMAKSRDDRPQSAAEVVREIDVIRRSRNREISDLPPAGLAHAPGSHTTSATEPTQTLSELFDAIQQDQRTVTLAPTPASNRSRNREISDLPPAGRANAPGSLTTSATKKRLLLALAGVASLVLAGILIKITHQDGRVTEIKVPDDAKVEVVQDESPRSRSRKTSDGGTKDAPNDRSLTTSATKNSKSEISNLKSQIPADPDRAAAEWVLSVGGSLKVVQDGATISLAPGAKLPDASFVIDHVDISGLRSKAKDKVIVIDDELARFAGLKGLRELLIQFNSVTDRGVAQLRDLPKLRLLSLDATQITDACADSILTLPNLDEFSLGHTKVTPAILAKLKSLPILRALSIDWPFTPMIASSLLKFPSLRHLDLHESWLTDAGITFLRERQVNSLYIEVEGTLSDERIQLLAALPRLERFGVQGKFSTKSELDITPSGCRRLADHPRLTSFVGREFPFTDEHLAAIAEIKGLETFQVFHYGNSSPLTDTGLEHLARLPKLKQLTLLKTQVTPAGLARFRAAKPDCQITTDVK